MWVVANGGPGLALVLVAVCFVGGAGDAPRTTRPCEVRSLVVRSERERISCDGFAMGHPNPPPPLRNVRHDVLYVLIRGGTILLLLLYSVSIMHGIHTYIHTRD